MKKIILSIALTMVLFACNKAIETKSEFDWGMPKKKSKQPTKILLNY